MDLSPVSWAYIIAAFNGFVAVLALSLAIGVYLFVRRTIVNEMAKMSNILPGAMESLSYAEIPIQVVALICNYMNISFEDMAKEYKKDSQNRRTIVIQTFRKDPVTMAFVDSFQSKFIQFGYVGEDLVTGNKE
ncbi:unnamed protein product [Bursaphelenchus okinawaensis]|uniref:Uncharacterized protein n=1 Tax=Bursaphelenchus okinawaensis TaxID=465554 RepID=A0A811LF18_9BILA|nr:unnamed protein product [Bursaphelenchus okinawaensis]CAG9121269.1 unnamed protein product [Bursaphelenchus okinawaensis]